MSDHQTTWVIQHKVGSSPGHRSRHHQVARRTLEVQRRLLGPEHPDVLCTINNLAAALHMQAQERDAEEVYTASSATPQKTYLLEVLRLRIYKNHQNVLPVWNAYTMFLFFERSLLDWWQGKQAEAICFQQEGLPTRHVLEFYLSVPPWSEGLDLLNPIFWDFEV